MNLTTFLAHKATLREMTARTVATMPETELASKLVVGSRSFAEIVLHIMQAEHMFCNILEGAQQEPPRPYTTEAYPTREALVDGLREQGEVTSRRVTALSEARLAEVIRAPFGVEMPGEAWLLLLASHESEHRGNLVMLAKMSGVKPPDIVDLIREKAASA
jgi:uncharacterized damage-inducible protein DinB